MVIRFCLGGIRPAAEFLHAHAQIQGVHTVQLLAQLRSTGRILDAHRLVLGGTEILDVDIDISEAIPNPRLSGWRLRFQIWPRDIALRRNMASSNWLDIEAIVAGRDAEILDDKGALIPQNEFLGILADSTLPNSGSVRWVVTSGDDASLQLRLQGLPGSAPSLNAKPILRK